MTALGLFEGYGVEIEYMIVDRDTMAVRPLSDRVLSAVAGEIDNEVEVGALCWSNELVLHVIELKTNGPVASLRDVAADFVDGARRIDALLAEHGARLLPGAMHPFMDPLRETRLWPHDDDVIYAAYDRIFDCRGHGWSNLQSVHLNLPFRGDDELARLHDAIRLLLPLLPALAASSPFADGRVTGWLDTRLDVYRNNSKRLPSITGRVVPERVGSRREYEAQILAPMYRDIAPLDPEGILQHEWLNSRGAIARFDRSAIEIRVLDVQETAVADLAVLGAIAAVLRGLVEAPPAQVALEPLAAIFLDVARDADAASIEHRDYLSALGVAGPQTAGELWRTLTERYPPDLDPVGRRALATILDEGPLARRMLRWTGPEPDRARLVGLCRELADCLAAGRQLGA